MGSDAFAVATDPQGSVANELWDVSLAMCPRSVSVGLWLDSSVTVSHFHYAAMGQPAASTFDFDATAVMALWKWVIQRHQYLHFDVVVVFVSSRSHRVVGTVQQQLRLLK